MSSNNQVDKREQILSAAEKLIAESSFQGLSMQKVAKEAGVAAGTIYRYFSDKEHLLNEVRLMVSKRIADTVQAGVSRDMPLKERYRTMWLNVWNLAASHMETISNRVQYESLPGANSQKTRELERKMFAELEQLFVEGKQQGIFKPLDNEILSGLSFETSIALAQKQAWGLYQLDNDVLDAAIDASWDAIINH